MRDCVRAAFVEFTAKFEGVVGGYLYQDVRGLVSTDIGYLADPLSLALPLPFVHADGTPATKAEITAEWIRIKDLPPDENGRAAAQLGHLYAKRFATLHLTWISVKTMTLRKMDENDAALWRRFREFEDWPADAQLATHSMAWACGSAFHFPHLSAALQSRDFMMAAEECHMDERGNPGLAPRNKANRILYQNAALGDDPSILYWPRDLAAEQEQT